jgi:hypothetical protein
VTQSAVAVPFFRPELGEPEIEEVVGAVRTVCSRVALARGA